MLVVSFDWGRWSFLLTGWVYVYRLVRAADSRGERLLAWVQRRVFDLLCAYAIPTPRPLPGTSRPPFGSGPRRFALPPLVADDPCPAPSRFSWG